MKLTRVYGCKDKKGKDCVLLFECPINSPLKPYLFIESDWIYSKYPYNMIRTVKVKYE